MVGYEIRCGTTHRGPMTMAPHVCSLRSFVNFDAYCEEEGVFLADGPGLQPLKIFVWHSPPVAPHFEPVKFLLRIAHMRAHITPAAAAEFAKEIMPEHLWSATSCDYYVAVPDEHSPSGFMFEVMELILVPGSTDPTVPQCFDVPVTPPLPPRSMKAPPPGPPPMRGPEGPATARPPPTTWHSVQV